MSSLSEMAEPGAGAGAGAGAEVTTVGGAETMVGAAVEAATAEVITPPSGTPASEVTPPGEGGSAPARGPWASTRSMMYL